MITADQNAAHPVAMEALTSDETLTSEMKLWHSKYMNSVTEQDHRTIKRQLKPIMRFGSFNPARRTLSRVEAMGMICKEQVTGISKGNGVSQAKFIEALFGVSA